MTQINLLPWREKERQIIKIIFGIIMAGCVIFTLVAMVFVHIYLNMENAIAIERNHYLQSVIDQTANETLALKLKQMVRDKTISELNLIINLRKKSYQAVSILNLLVNALPATVLIEKLARVDNVFALEGIASSDLETTAFMKNIQAVNGYKQPVLNVIKTQEPSSATGNNQLIQFELKVEQQE